MIPVMPRADAASQPLRVSMTASCLLALRIIAYALRREASPRRRTRALLHRAELSQERRGGRGSRRAARRRLIPAGHAAPCDAGGALRECQRRLAALILHVHLRAVRGQQ